MPRRPTIGAQAAVGCLAVLVAASALADVAGLSSVARLIRPASQALGIDQDWRMFAPHPRRTGIRVEAIVAWSDGVHTVWRAPSGEPLLHAYRDYRWRKWQEHSSFAAEAPDLWRAAARYVIRRLEPRGEAEPVALRLIRVERPVPPPGSAQQPRWTRVVLYRARLGQRG